MDKQLDEEMRVTVIATGFNHNGKLSSLNNGRQKYLEYSDNPMSDLDIPTYQRITEKPEPALETENIELAKEEVLGTAGSNGDLDVPAYLRRRTD